MSKIFSRWLPCATLATWSAILLYFFFSGRIHSLLAPPFRPWVLAAGLVLGLMSATFLFAPADASCCAAADCGPTLARLPIGKVLTFVTLLLPVVAAAFVSPDSFGKAAIENRGIDTTGAVLPARTVSTFTPPEMPLPTKDGSPAPAPAAAEPASPVDYLQRSPDGNIVAEVLDLLYAAQDEGLRKDFEGKKVELVGQLMPDKSGGANGVPRFKAVRMFMTCCAADARPVATLVETDKLPELPEMTWVKITGVSTFPMEKGKRTAVLQAERVEKTAPPDEAMLF